MDSTARSRRFAELLALELKGQIVARGSSGRAIARETGHTDAVVNRWLNGKREIPTSFLYKVCGVIGVSVQHVVELAEARLMAELQTPVDELAARRASTASAPDRLADAAQTDDGEPDAYDPLND